MRSIAVALPTVTGRQPTDSVEQLVVTRWPTAERMLNEIKVNAAA
jgi:hypothetical protein